MTATTTRPVSVVRSESDDTRLVMLNSLLTTPHRSLGLIHPIHSGMISSDPRFYVQLAAWHVGGNGEVRDHNEMFIVNLCLSAFPGHKDVGLSLLRELPPYQVARVLNFIKGGKVKKSVRTGEGKAKTTTVTEEKVGLFRNVPGSIVTEITRYLRERENDPEWFDSTVLTARKDLKRLYASLHVKPSDRAQKILFEEEFPSDSRLNAIKALRKAEKPSEQAQIIIENKIPYRVASTVVTTMSPTVILALIEVMSDQELINNLGSLKRRGALDSPELKEAIGVRLERAKKGKRVASMKGSVAKKAADLDEDTAKKLDDIGDAQIKAKGRITRSTAVCIDKSQSMSTSIEVGKRIASMISAIMDAPLKVYAFDTMPYEVSCAGKELSDWEKAMQGIYATGGTACGAGIDMLLRSRTPVEQIVMVSDQDEQSTPAFLASYQKYARDMKVQPRMVFVRCGSKMVRLEVQCKANGIEFDSYTFDGDYFSLPGLVQYLTKSSKLDLLMTIMSWKLPVRRA